MGCPACAVPPEEAPSGQAPPQEDLSGQQQQEGFQDPSGTDLGGDDFQFPDDGFGGDSGLHASDASTVVVSHQYRQVGSGEHVDSAPDPPIGGHPAAAWQLEMSSGMLFSGAVQLPVSAAALMLQRCSGW